MTHMFKLAHRFQRLGAAALTAVVFALAGCDNANTFNPDSSTPAGDGSVVDPITVLDEDGEEQSATELAPVTPPTLSAAFAGGIPFGHFETPVQLLGDRYNGAKMMIGTSSLLSQLAAVKARGGRIVLMMAGSQRYYKDASGHFSLTKWKDRVARYRGVNFGSYINDGTIIGHYMIDEPYDAYNWNGRPVSGATLEEMAKYSKQLWPNLPTIVRAEPYLIKWSGTYRYLDAAWAQYLARKGNAQDYIRRNVSEAQRMGLGLVVGLNLLKGGNPNGTWMNANEVETFGSALLSSSYPCAFISWQYNANYLASSGMSSAMSRLRQKSENRATRSCRGS